MPTRRPESQQQQDLRRLREKHSVHDKAVPAHADLNKVIERPFLHPSDTIIFIRVALMQVLRNIDTWYEKVGTLEGKRQNLNIFAAVTPYLLSFPGTTEIPVDPTSEIAHQVMESVLYALNTIFTNYGDGKAYTELGFTSEHLEVVENIRRKGINLGDLVDKTVHKDTKKQDALFLLEVIKKEKGGYVVGMKTIDRSAQKKALEKLPAHLQREQLETKEGQVELFTYLAFSRFLVSLVRTMKDKQPLSSINDTNLLREGLEDLKGAGLTDTVLRLHPDQVKDILGAFVGLLYQMVRSITMESKPEDFDLEEKDFNMLQFLKRIGKLDDLLDSIRIVDDGAEDAALPESVALLLSVRLKKEGQTAGLFVRGRNRKKQKV